MRVLILSAVALSLSSAPVLAEDQAGEGLSLMERGARLFLEGMMDELDPTIRDLKELADDFEPALRDFAETMGPALRGLIGEVEDWSQYHPPEVLPNGDIILRRKQPGDSVAPPQGDIDL